MILINNVLEIIFWIYVLTTMNIPSYFAFLIQKLWFISYKFISFSKICSLLIVFSN